MKHWRVGEADNGKALWFGPDINIQCMEGELADKIAAEHNATVDTLATAEARLKSAEARVQELQRERDALAAQLTEANGMTQKRATLWWLIKNLLRWGHRGERPNDNTARHGRRR